MALKEPKFKHDQTILKVLGNQIHIIHVNFLRTAGVECPFEQSESFSSDNETKLFESISRSKRLVKEISLCNPWEWFFTATFSEDKISRNDLSKLNSTLSQWFRNYNKRFSCHVKFLLIPELHKDKTNWHMHGLLYGLPVEHLIPFRLGDVMGKAIADKVRNGEAVYNWPPYYDKFGFCDLEPIKDLNRASSYITKYITMRVLSYDEQKVLLEACKSSRYSFVFEFALSTGLRLGEVLGLCWDDVDFNRRLFTVNHTLKRISNRSSCGDNKTLLFFSNPKTVNSQREIPLSDYLFSKLWAMFQSRSFETKQVFCTKLGTIQDPRHIQDFFHRTVLRLGLVDVSFHTLRHTFATRALEAGIPIKTVSSILGHSTVNITMDLYQHVSLDTKRNAFLQMSSLLPH